ncbi:PAS/PAC sensor signal transduction histidine kinase [Flavobacterium limnosediminis JC2902]|uniref:histidine kinase n=1 Tax=Flavobacterium limnosediminis JC2902 TaxID=1341181 RepID=V6SV12_9FLAO|nr:ATP-binding protein [Flavobacterium limnosediminis]ESU28255.1 PAS/PAC sensor signal transduction histidine kinase [Flavobacterium limnosediminis JC2902]
MKIKTKLTLGVGLLFFLIVLLVALGVRQVHVISNDTKNILVANYNSLDYSRNMLKELDKIETENQSFQKFNGFLKLQLQNITEIGEKELTQSLVDDVANYQNQPDNKTAAIHIRKDLNDIMKLNMDAIQRKSVVASKTAQGAILWISITGATCFIIAFTLLVNLPSSIADPIKDLTESIRQIAAKNYHQRVHFENHNEFGDLAKSFNTMAEKLQEYNDSNLAKLMTEKKRIETLINNMHDPVIGLDDKNNILLINEEALKISGLNAGEVIGKPAQEVALSNDLLRSLLQHLVNDEFNKNHETLKIYADKKESYFEKQLVPIGVIPTGEKEKKQIGSFIILRNVTAYKELDDAKTNFIATVSHEFKTPIASMKMSLQLLENEGIGKLNSEQKGLIHSIYDDADRLLKTTGELLNITQVESGKTRMHIELCEIGEIVKHSVESTKNLAEQNNIALQVHIEENLPQINADSEKTAWVISNLISNAIRYSYENSSVAIKAKKVDRTVKVSVIDNGLGISSQYKDRIFDKYFRVPGTEKEGTGLGLAISKEFIEAQGGTISVESELGSGSTFTISFKSST